MKLKPIVTSLLTQDLYKLSMGQVIYHQFPSVTTTWTFACRNKDIFFTPEMVEEIKEQIKYYCTLHFTEDNLNYLRTIEWLKEDYISFLKLWHPCYEDFVITTDANCGLSLEAKGTWLNTSMYEVPVLAIINEVYFSMKYRRDELLLDFTERLEEKAFALESKKYILPAFSEFGLRRRLSGTAQELVVKRFKQMMDNTKYPSSNFIGTSNLYLAQKYNVKPVGTMAHELIMCIGQGDPKHNPAYSNYYALKAWVKEYGVLNGIALTDTITTDCFLKDFNKEFAILFSGVRHDSGDPKVWGDKIIAHYESLGIDPKTKTLLFSDSLDFKKADELYWYFKDRINVAFGIGTYLSNDTSVPALNIVIKVTEVNHMPVAKISDCEGKCMCKDAAYVEYLQRSITWRMEHE